MLTAESILTHMSLYDHVQLGSSKPVPEQHTRSFLSAKACSVLRQMILRQLNFEHIAALHNKKFSRSHLATYTIPPSLAAAEAIFATPSLRVHFAEYTKWQVADAGRTWLWALAMANDAGALRPGLGPVSKTLTS